MRLNAEAKIIVGRTQKDNEHIMAHVDPHRDTVLKVIGHPGPTVVLPGEGTKELLFLAGAICAGYSKASGSDTIQVQVTRDGNKEKITVLPILPEEAKRFLIR